MASKISAPVSKRLAQKNPVTLIGSSTDKPSKTLFDLCDESHRRKRPRKEIGNSDQDQQGIAKDSRKSVEILKRKQPIIKSCPPTQESHAGPQVEIINGKIVIKESSLTMNEDNGQYDGEFEEVSESIHATATYSSFLTHPRFSKSWGIEETRRFYEALRQCGTDFSLMQAFFPDRTRKQLKLKFFREEKQLPELIKCVLNTTQSLDIQLFETYFGQDSISLPVPARVPPEDSTVTSITTAASIAFSSGLNPFSNYPISSSHTIDETTDLTSNNEDVFDV